MLTDDKILEIAKGDKNNRYADGNVYHGCDNVDILAFARAIIAAHEASKPPVTNGEKI